MKKLIVVLIALLVLPSISLAAKGGNKPPPNADLQNQINANATSITDLQTQIDGLNAENSSLQDQINNLGDYDGTLQNIN